MFVGEFVGALAVSNLSSAEAFLSAQYVILVNLLQIFTWTLSRLVHHLREGALAAIHREVGGLGLTPHHPGM